MAAAAYLGGRGQGADGGWFVPGAGDGWAPPWGRRGGGGAAAAAAAAAGERETLAVVMARRAPPPSAIRRDAVRVAEAAAGEVLLRVHPTREAERRRQDVIAYLTRLIGSSLGCEVRARVAPRPASPPLRLAFRFLSCHAVRRRRRRLLLPFRERKFLVPATPVPLTRIARRVHCTPSLSFRLGHGSWQASCS
jgi:hypothetical protein